MRPIFIGGTGRSGTTIMRQVLGTHPEVAAFQREARFIIDPGGLTDLADAVCGRWCPSRANRAARRFVEMIHNLQTRSSKRAGRQAFAAWPGLQDTVDRLIRALSWDSYERGERGAPRAFIEIEPAELSVIRFHLRGFLTSAWGALKNGASLMAEDTPENINAAMDLVHWWPQAVIVHAVRDPLDVAASYTRQRWGHPTALGSARRIRSILEHAETVPVHHVIRLEEFARDPRKALALLCGHVGIDPADLDVSSVDSSRAHVGRWRKELGDPGTTGRVQQELQDVRERLGYT